jgi:hypothetical protein
MSEPYWEPLGAQPVLPGLSLISDQILGAAVASVTFDAIPQTFKHLKLEAGYACSGSSPTWITGKLNNLATNIFDTQNQYANAATNTASETAPSAVAYLAYGYPQNGMFEWTILNYLSALQKLARNTWFHDWGGHTTGVAGRHIGHGGHLINLLVPITRIDIITPNTFLTGSRFTLYGMA